MKHRTQPRRSTRARVTTDQAKTATAQKKFLISFATSCSISRAARDAGVGRRTVYDWQRHDARFNALLDDAKEEAADALELEARRRAIEGTLEPVYQKGRKVGTIRRYSDALLITLLKGRRPDVFRDRYEHSGPNGEPFRPHVQIYLPENGRRRRGQEKDPES